MIDCGPRIVNNFTGVNLTYELANKMIYCGLQIMNCDMDCEFTWVNMNEDQNANLAENKRLISIWDRQDLAAPIQVLE